MANVLIGSASTQEQLIEGIEKYFCGTKIKVLEDGYLQRLSDNKILDGFVVIKRKGRYRFECSVL